MVAPGGKDEEQDGPPHVLRVKGPSLPYDPTYHLLYRVDKVRSRIMRERPDVIEIHSPYVAAIAALAVPRRTRSYRAIRTFQWHADFIDTYLRPAIGGETSDGEARGKIADVALDPLWRWVRAIGEGCDATLVAARWQEKKLLAHGVPRVHRIPFGIDKQVFVPQRRSDEVRSELLGESHASHPRAQLLLSVGRFATEKRWDVVIDAFLAYRARRLAHPEAGPVVLALFGDGPERARMEARAAGCPDVRFLGFARGRERLASAMASADALLHGCPYETYGLSIAEALSTGLPALVPDEGGAAEMLGDGAPRGGLRYRALDVLACSSAIAAILEKAESLRPAAIEQAATVPSVEASVEATAELYERLLAQR